MQRGILLAIDASRKNEAIHNLGCMERVRVEFPILVECYPGSFSLPRRFDLNVTVRSHEHLKDKTKRHGTLHKAVAAYHSPFDQTLVLDADACVVHNRLKEVFTPLRDFDFVSVWECCAKGGQPIYGTGWEPQTGVFAIRNTARQLMMDWYNEFWSRTAHYKTFSSTDQQAMLRVLLDHRYSYFPLPSTYNFRTYTMPLSPNSNTFDQKINVFHSHSLKNEADTAAEIKSVARGFLGRVEQSTIPMSSAAEKTADVARRKNIGDRKFKSNLST